jgi:hypothetical protein
MRALLRGAISLFSLQLIKAAERQPVSGPTG